MRSRLLVAATLALTLAACGEAGDADRHTAGQALADELSGSAKAAAPAQSPQAFADAIAASDAYALAAARLAQAQAQSPAVKQFAAQIIQDQTVTTDELRDAAKRTHGVSVDPAPTKAQQQELLELRQAGDGFDNLYLRQQIDAHEQALEELRDYAENGDDPSLTEFAANAENMIADHLRFARQPS